jgi:alginate O-acetyltransferase complex protein AlgI
MTLSRWFRDYVYIPLGGNRHGPLRTLVNLWIVFFLCGLWHGAGLTFIVWGLYHGALLILERLAGARLRWRPPRFIGVVATFALVSIGWVFFRSPTLAAAGHYLQAMFLLGPAASASLPLAHYLTLDVVTYLGLGAIFAFAPFDRLFRLRFDRIGLLAAQFALSTLSLAASMLLLAANSFNPFIYFRF